MKYLFYTKLLPILSVPIGLAIVLVPFSLLIGWSIFTIVLFWFVMTPALAEYLPTFVSKRKDTLYESLSGTLLSYAIMVFMIYTHYQTDMFLMIMASCGFNMIAIKVISRVRNVYQADTHSTVY